MALVVCMESFPSGTIELARPNIMQWGQDLTTGPRTAGAVVCRDRIFELGKRIDRLAQVETGFETSEEEAVAVLETGADSHEEVDEEWIENEETVRISFVKPL